MAGGRFQEHTTERPRCANFLRCVSQKGDDTRVNVVEAAAFANVKTVLTGGLMVFDAR
jgi:hypothetical protein